MFRQLSRQMVRTLPRPRLVYLRPVHSTLEQQQKRKPWNTSYSRMTIAQAQNRLGFRFKTFESHAIPVDRMLAEAQGGIESLRMDAILKVKEKVYDLVLDHLEIEGFPIGTSKKPTLATGSTSL